MIIPTYLNHSILPLAKRGNSCQMDRTIWKHEQKNRKEEWKHGKEKRKSGCKEGKIGQRSRKEKSSDLIEKANRKVKDII